MKPAETNIMQIRRSEDALPAEFYRKYLNALRTADPQLANQTAVDALDAGLSPAAVHSYVLAPAMREIGELWEHGRVNVGEEHVATAITHQVLIRILDRTRSKNFHSQERERVMLAAVQGQHHVLGLRMVADLLEGAGYDVLYLGADVPVDSLRDLAATKDPALVGLSFGISMNMADLAESIYAVRQGAPGCRLMLGGRAPPPDSDMFGVPWLSDGIDVISVVEKLLSEPPQQIPSSVGNMRNTNTSSGETPKITAGVDPDSMVKVLSSLSADASESARGQFYEAERFRQLSLQDPVTGLANRRAFDDGIFSHISEGTGKGALLMMDLDNFKLINDSLGHEQGDESLRLVGKAITDSIRPSDLGARIGGDEFAVLLPDSSTSAAKIVSERVQELVRELSDGQMTLSIGISGVSGDARQTMLAADRALFAAKDAGRDRVMVDGEFEPTLSAAVSAPAVSQYMSVSRLQIPAVRSAELIAAFRERIGLVESADGFIDLEVLQSDADDEEIVMVSRWRDREAFKAYMKSEAHEKSHARIDPDLQNDIKLISLEHLHTYEVVAR